MGLLRSTLLWASENKAIEEQFRRRRFARTAVSRFMPGETLDDALKEGYHLHRSGIGTVITLLGENVDSVEAVEPVVAHYEGAFETIGSADPDTHISVKLTQLGLDQGEEVALNAVRRLAAAAAGAGSVLWIDMEYSRYVEATLRVFRSARAEGYPMGLCLQAYLHRTPRDVDLLVREAAPVRLVKGAYLEPADVAIPKKSDVDRQFLKLALQLAGAYDGEGPRPGIATHDLDLIREFQAQLNRPGTAPPPYEVQMLYGIQREAQLELARAGIPVRVLISYGEAWFPWYVRRLAERPANVGFVLRSMFSG